MDEFTSKVLQTLTNLGLNPALVEECRRYIEGELPEDELFPGFPEIILLLLDRYLSRTGKEDMAEYLRNNAAEVANNIGRCGADARECFLEMLFELDKEKYLPTLVSFLGDPAKGVRTKVINLLAGYREAFRPVSALLADKKMAVRESAVLLLSAWNDEESRKVLGEAFLVEKQEKIKVQIANALQLSPEAGADGSFNIIDYCKDVLKKNKGKAIAWIDFDSFPPVRHRNSGEEVDGDVVKYLIMTYAVSGKMTINSEAEKISRELNGHDLADVALALLNTWLENGAEVKKKWVLPLACIHGDDRTVMVLQKKIEEWPEKGRGAIACDAVMSLALNGSSVALMFIDNISRKFKFRQVKEAAAKAFGFAARELGVDPEELSDKIVPDLGFDVKGEKIYDYGARKFVVRLSPALELEICDEKGKKIKTLPSPGKNDEKEKAGAALNEFKLLKKQLKSVAAIQTLRLETALATGRKWTEEAWRKLFVENPLLQQFAIGLVWGTYTENRLQESFRYMEDGTFTTVGEDEYQIPAGAYIGLVHPLELQGELPGRWAQQLEDYEVKQPFEQLARKVYLVNGEEKEAKSVERFAGIIINARSLQGKLAKLGWYRGSVQDGGWYSDFYKEDGKLGIGVELRFSGAGVGYESEEDATVYELVFYNAGTVARGSYIYDEIKENELIRPARVPVRLFSEILYDVERATAARTGLDEHWRVNR